MVKKFWDDPYATQLATHVTNVDEDNVTLEETIFYAFSGGQERDEGTIGGHTVVDARKDGLDIIYTLKPDHTLKTGDAVLMWRSTGSAATGSYGFILRQ